MGAYKRTIPGDNTRLPGMKTIMADYEDRNNVTYIPDVEYVKRGEEALHLQLLIPRGIYRGMGVSYKYPLVVYVPGGAWQYQDMYYNLPALVMLARKGFVVASVRHRPSTEAGFPAHLQDTKSAIRFLRAHAEEYFINPDAVAIWGDSSGGHTALLVGVTGDMEEFKTEDYTSYSDAVSAVVDFYGPTDVSKFNTKPRNPEWQKDLEHSVENILFGGRVDLHPELAAPGNPINYVTEEKELPPFLIAHGDHDALVPFNQSVLMVEKLQSCNQMVEFYKVCGGEHGFYLWTDELIDIVDKFLKAYLPYI